MRKNVPNVNPWGYRALWDNLPMQPRFPFREGYFLPAALLAAVFLCAAFVLFSVYSARPEHVLDVAATSSPALGNAWKTASGKKPQFIVFSFDGSKSIDMWEKTRSFAREMRTEGKPIDFTYFINAAYFLLSAHKMDYQGPGHRPGETPLGFAKTPDEVSQRVAEVNAAYAEGHEIGSHSAGHFMGDAWSAAQWSEEFASFADLLFNIGKHNPELATSSRFAFGPAEIAGFRAPGLAVSPGLYDTLAADHFRYDASMTGRNDRWPYRLPDGLWEFPLGSVKLGGKTTLAMDFNFYTDQTGAQDSAREGTPQWIGFFGDLKSAYDDYFNQNYSGSRAPMYIANHFSEWNGDLYWQSVKAFASEVCGKSEVHCVSYKELAGYLDAALESATTTPAK